MLFPSREEKTLHTDQCVKLICIAEGRAEKGGVSLFVNSAVAVRNGVVFLFIKLENKMIISLFIIPIYFHFLFHFVSSSHHCGVGHAMTLLHSLLCTSSSCTPKV